MRWLRRGLIGLLALVVVLVGFVLARTLLSRPAATRPAIELAGAPAIEANAAAAHLAEAIRFRTISREPGKVEDPQAFRDLYAFLERTYPRTHAAFQREFVRDFSLLYTLPGADPQAPPMLLMAHMDVVPVEAGTEGDWEAPPFSGELVDGHIYGRGANDDKGSLIAIFEAAEALLAQGFRPRRTILLAFGHDEETLGSGAQATAALLRTRNIRPWFVLDEGMQMILDEPTTGGPVALVGTAEKGYLTVRVTARAEGGHSSMPPADTAAERLSRAILAIRARRFPGGLNGPAVETLQALAPDLAFVERMAVANRWAFGGLIQRQLGATPSGDALLRTTIAPTIVRGGTKENVLPQEMHALVNLRLHPRDDVQSALAHLRRSAAGIDGVSIDVEGEPREPSPVSRIENESYALIAATARAHAPQGAPVAPMLVLGASDSRFYVPIAEDVYRYAPVWAQLKELGRIHGTGERMSVENLARMADFYAQLIATGAR